MFCYGQNKLNEWQRWIDVSISNLKYEINIRCLYMQFTQKKKKKKKKKKSIYSEFRTMHQVIIQWMR